MSADPKQARRQLPYRLLRTQVLVAALVSCLWLTLSGVPAAKAALFGGFIGVATNFYFAVRSLSLPPGASAQQMLSAMMRAQVVKLLLAALLFALAAKFFGEYYPALLSAWFATTAVYLLALRWL